MTPAIRHTLGCLGVIMMCTGVAFEIQFDPSLPLIPLFGIASGYLAIYWAATK